MVLQLIKLVMHNIGFLSSQYYQLVDIEVKQNERKFQKHLNQYLVKNLYGDSNLKIIHLVMIMFEYNLGKL